MHKDFRELLSAVNAGHVRYLIVGGYAASLHAQPRATKHLDILIGADAPNSEAVYAALAKFGAPIEGLSARDFAEPDNLFRMATSAVASSAAEAEIVVRLIGRSPTISRACFRCQRFSVCCEILSRVPVSFTGLKHPLRLLDSSFPGYAKRICH